MQLRLWQKFLLPSLLLASSFLAPQAAAQETWDPIEPVNRGVFWFNDKFDVYLFEPVARGWNWLLPKPVQKSVDNFFLNLKFPVYLANSLMQLKFEQAARHTGRFLLNTSIGVGGLFDPAKDFGMAHHHEDFGVTLGYHGVPPGPYIVIPILGPSNLRDLTGRGVDFFLDPIWHLDRWGDLSTSESWTIGISTGVVDGINTRAELLTAIEAAKDASLDYYLFAQSAYYQVRQNLIYDDNPPGKDDFEDEFDDEFEDEEFEE